MTMDRTVCERCLNSFEFSGDGPAPTECRVCVKLGDRSLVWFLRAFGEAETDTDRTDVLRRFEAAKGRAMI